ncbi:DUF1569 domain-containing protein [Dyadobacter chenwenxiniae]|uniref:DUF1569 domain-containing protein n=1 Tax=Dyadobacter chenwenxiniae TaxID=2906456 RepID=A0A9X1TFD4_9BACT|nr:DUF1569 domain-containing protein [Dyadobacter chenwenxiniae]MCF0062499.1 DUF1569 domain-containing protein [Dyadobacter chenwenxiniae]UON83755.1 DUF1569 domain-containing protein [Dyadobacter chenwenxiniae]
MENIFEPAVAAKVIDRINNLTPETRPEWGKMEVSQMMAHCNVAYEMAFENKHPKPNALMRWFIQMMAKSTVCGDKPYKKSQQTAPAFLIKDKKDFETEKSRLIGYIRKSEQLGSGYFEGKESLSFGKLSSEEWNTMFYKHLNHHLTQFGV